MSATLINLKNRKRLNAADFQPGKYLWWGYTDSTDELAGGYPVQIVSVNFEAGEFNYIALNSTEDNIEPGKITYPYLQPAEEARVREYVRKTLVKRSEIRSYSTAFTFYIKVLIRELRKAREDKVMLRQYRRKSRQRGLL